MAAGALLVLGSASCTVVSGASIVTDMWTGGDGMMSLALTVLQSMLGDDADAGDLGSLDWTMLQWVIGGGVGFLVLGLILFLVGRGLRRFGARTRRPAA